MPPLDQHELDGLQEVLNPADVLADGPDHRVRRIELELARFPSLEHLVRAGREQDGLSTKGCPSLTRVGETGSSPVPPIWCCRSDNVL
jgi:hypothetical protein